MSTPAQTPSPGAPDPIWFQLFNEIGIIHQLSSTVFSRVLPAPLSLAGFTVLNHLERLPGDWGPARLARAFQVTKGAMTNTIQRLEAAGLVVLENDGADGRQKFVRITPEGRAKRREALARLAPSLSKIDAALAADDARAMMPTLVTLRTWLDANR